MIHLFLISTIERKIHLFEMVNGKRGGKNISLMIDPMLVDRGEQITLLFHWAFLGLLYD